MSRRNKLSIWVNEEVKDVEKRRVILDGTRVWFATNLFWTFSCMRGSRIRQITTHAEMKERLNETGYRFLGFTDKNEYAPEDF